MQKEHFEAFAQNIAKIGLGDLIERRGYFFGLRTKTGRMYYEKEYTSEFSELKPDEVYLIRFDSVYEFEFKCPKNPDSIFKSFVAQFISKCMMQAYLTIDGDIKKPTREQCYQKFRQYWRVSKFQYYTTLYGIGTYCFFCNDEQMNQMRVEMGGYLKAQGFDFSNEYSDERWVYRWKIKGADLITHNTLLENFQTNSNQ